MKGKSGTGSVLGKPAEGEICCSNSCLALPQPLNPNGATVQQLDRCRSARHTQETASYNGKRDKHERLRGTGPCHHGYMAVALAKQQKGDGLSTRDDTCPAGKDAPWLLGYGAGGMCSCPVLLKGAGPPLHVALMVPLEVVPTHQSGPPAPVGGTHSPRAASISCRASASCSEKHRPGCLQQLSMFHTRSMIAFVLQGKTKEASQHFLLLLHRSREAELLRGQETSHLQILIKPPKWLEWLEAAGLQVHISVSARQHQCLVNVLH